MIRRVTTSVAVTGALLAALSITPGPLWLGLAEAGQAGQPANTSYPMTVYKSPTCGCCAKWNDHMRAAGFAVTSNDLADVSPIKTQHGVPMQTRSCHTALVGGYAIEGHVPADVVKKLLRERPAIAGIAAPGMPAGSPGMEMPDGRKDTYQIVAFDKQGKTSVYATR
jgi:hypothetical protein